MEKQEKKSSDEKEKSELYKYIMSDSFEEYVDTKNLKDLKKYEGILKSNENKLRAWTKFFLITNLVLFIGIILFVAYIAYVDYTAFHISDKPVLTKFLFKEYNVFVICLCVLIEIVIFSIRIFLLEKYDNKKQLITRQIRIIQRQNSTSNEKKEKDFFDRIIDINNDNLSDYYQQVRKNVNNLLYVGIFVGLAGFLFIFISLIIGAISGKNINLVYLSTVTGIIIDSFAGTFFIQYGKSIKNMQFYFEGLLKTQDKIIEMKGQENKQKELSVDTE